MTDSTRYFSASATGPGLNPAMDANSTDRRGLAAGNWLLPRKILAAAMLIFAFLSIGYALSWFIADFVSLSVNSPNNSAEGQVLDFDHLSYVSDGLRDSSFPLGAILLVLSILLNGVAVNLLAQRPYRKKIYIFGGAGLFLLAMFLAQSFQWPILIGFLLTALALYLTTELEDEFPESPILGDAELNHEPEALFDIHESSDQLATAEPVATQVEAEYDSEALSDETSLDLMSGDAEPVPEPSELVEALEAEPESQSSGEDLERFVQEISTDINIDTEDDYQLAALNVKPESDYIAQSVQPEMQDSSEEEQDAVDEAMPSDTEHQSIPVDANDASETDEFAMGTQEQEPWKIDEIAAEQAVEIESSGAGLGERPSVAANESEVSQPESPQQNEPADQELENDFVVDPKSDLFEELAAMGATEEKDPIAERVPVYEQQDLPLSLQRTDEAGSTEPPELASISSTNPMGFDPQQLSREEALLPPPQRSLWNLLDWVVVSLIALCIILAIGISFL